MAKTLSLSRDIIASDDFRCLSTDAQAMYLQCCAYAEDAGIIKDFWLISDSYLFRCEENITNELAESGYITEVEDNHGAAKKYKITHWDKHCVRR